MPVGPLLSMRGSEARVFQTPAGLMLHVWGAVPGSRRLRKRCVPDDGSLGIPGDRVRLTAVLRDTEPTDPHRGVAFWRGTRLGQYIPHTMSRWASAPGIPGLSRWGAHHVPVRGLRGHRDAAVG